MIAELIMFEFIAKIVGWLIDISAAYNPIDYLKSNFLFIVSHPLLMSMFVVAFIALLSTLLV